MDKKQKACNRRQTIDANLNATMVIIITVLLLYCYGLQAFKGEFFYEKNRR